MRNKKQVNAISDIFGFLLKGYTASQHVCVSAVMQQVYTVTQVVESLAVG